ncbi:MAG: hypothetical protein E7080_04960 [Bacteroidales bacterium]|nr:hypothetical protein [Bacteroidales bacterium]
MSSKKKLAALIVSVLLSNIMFSQNISEIAKSDPLIISGAIGTQNTYRYSSVGNSYGSPLSNTVYANLNISLYGFNMPFSLYYSNDNLSFNYPQISFNLNPSYKNWTGYFGESSMAMSTYVMNMSFNGIGLEYSSDKVRAGLFYGRLRNAINADPTDPYARTPQYKRMGWGFKVGYGSGKNYVDLYMLRAYDCINSIDELWQQQVSPQENLVVGIKGCVTPFNWLSLTANAATSVFNTDTRANNVPVKTDFDDVFDVKYSSLMRFAGDLNANINIKGVNASISYRMIQPDYTSLGTYYMSNNYHSLGITLGTTLFNKVSFSGTFSGQEDNLSKKQLYTTCGYIYAANASMRLGKQFNITAGYNGYLQTQKDGTRVINDTTRVHRIMSSYSLTPSYFHETENLGHNISLSANLTQNKDLNKFSAGESDVKTSAFGLSYNIDVKPIETDFTLTYSHQESKGFNSKYISDVASLGTSRSFLKEKNLSLSATVSLCYNEVERQSKSLSLGADFSASFNLKKVHLFSASAAFNKYGDVNITQTQSGLDCTDITVSLNYTYTFTLLAIKRKVKNEELKY